MMNHQTKHESGQALILIALAAIGLFAFAALAIDGSRQFSNKRHAQNAADTAVLTAALAKVRGQDYVAAAVARAKSNGYGLNPDSTVEVNLCSDTGIICEGLPTTGVVNKSEYIRVKIITTIPTTFGRVIGRQTMVSAAEAIAHVKGNSSTGSGSPFTDAGMISTKSGNYNDCLLLNGGADLEIHGSAIDINCSGTRSGFMNNNIHLKMDGPGKTAGCYSFNGSPSLVPPAPGTFACNQTPKTYDENSFASVPTMPAVPACGPTRTYDNSKSTIDPGTYTTNVAINKDTVMNPGVYCFNGGMNVNGSAKLSGPSGTVTMVMGNNDLNFGTTEFVFNDIRIFTHNGSFRTNGNGGLITNNLRFYSSGSGNFNINGNGWLKSGNKDTGGGAYIYLKDGEISWNGNSKIDLYAIAKDSPEGVGGLLIHMPWSNDTPIKFNGGSNIHMTGTSLMPHSFVTFNGGVNFELHSQIIAYEYIVNGGGTVDIWYVADENYNPAAPAQPVIEFVK